MRKRVGWTVTGVVLVCVALLAGPTVWTHAASSNKIFTLQTVPKRPVALVLGAGVRPDGSPSKFLKARLDTAYQLWKAGKVSVLVLSGDGSAKSHNEPAAMSAYLLKLGLPPHALVTDPAGLDTYSSCSRLQKVFGVSEVTVVTQSFHLPRAIALCQALGLNAVGVGDDTVKKHRKDWIASRVREVVANMKAAAEALGKPAVNASPQNDVTEALVASGWQS